MSFLWVGIWYWRWWKLKLILDLCWDLWVVYLDLIVVKCFNLPFIFVVEVQSFVLVLTSSTSWIRAVLFQLNPCLEPDMEFPSSTFQFLGCKILLISILHEIKCKEKGLKIKLLKVTLSIEHCWSWKVSIYFIFFLLILNVNWATAFFILEYINRFIDRNWTFNINNILILEQWNVYKRIVKNFNKSIFIFTLFFISRKEWVHITLRIHLKINTFHAWRLWTLTKI